MSASRLGTIALALLFGAALWLRVSSLGAIPWHDGDESYEGVELARMLQGQRFTLFTTNGNLMDPFFLAMQAPFQLIAKPSLSVLRAPAAVSGVLAVVFALVLGARVLDVPTATTAAVLLATLPAAVVYSRIGYEYCQIPLVGVVVIYFALKGDVRGLTLALLAALLVHPINVFLVPIVAPIFLTPLLRKKAGDYEQPRKVLWASAAMIAGLALVIWFIGRRPVARANFAARPTMDWSTFLFSVEKFYLFQYHKNNAATLLIQRWVFRGVTAAVSGIGLWQLTRDRHWERLSVVGGLLLGLVSFHFLTGPLKLASLPEHRYGVVFLAPAAFAFACLAQGLFAGRVIREASLAALGGALLFTAWSNGLAPMQARSRESLWTFRVEVKDPFEQALTLIFRDLIQNPGGRDPWEPCVVVGQDFWIAKPLEYLASWNRRIEVELLVTPEEARWDIRDPKIETRVKKRREQLIARLRAGAYAVGPLHASELNWANLIEETIASSFRPEQVEQWMVANAQGDIALVVYRLKAEATVEVAEKASDPPT